MVFYGKIGVGGVGMNKEIGLAKQNILINLYYKTLQNIIFGVDNNGHY
jgi:hypothetical protein